MKKLVGIVMVLLLLGVDLWSQSVSVSQINGTVKDQSGAILPGVEVKATQTDTQFSRTTITDEMGAYGLSNLPVGPYRLEASLAGFRAYVQTGIILQVNTNPAIPIILEVGATSESIQVTADAAMVETRQNGVGQIVDQRRIDDLPLNGRQVTQLITLSGAAVAGVATGNSRVYPSAINVSIAGGTGTGTNYLLDGAYHNDANTNVGLPLPFPDALQEFKVETSAVPARYGLHPGGTVNVVTKSGTNDFHGGLFEFVRNNAFNARNPFATKDDGLKRNQFGGTIGGPIKKNKLFFFGAFQATVVRVEPNSLQTFVPTADMRAGDFTTIASAACNGGRAITLGAPFQNNRLDPSQFSKVAVNLLKYAPISNDPCGRIIYGQRADNNEQQFTGRMDYQRSDKNSFFGRYYVANYSHPPQFDGTNILLAPGNSAGLGNTSLSHALVIGNTYTFSPTFISSFRLTGNRVASLRTPSDKLFTWSDLGANVSSDYTGPGRSFFNMTITNGFGGSGFPGYFMTNGLQLVEDLDVIRGRHQFSFGANWIYAQHNGHGPFQENGVFAFDGSRSGGNRIGFADFFAGLPQSFNQANGQIVYERLNYFGFYLQDAWKVSQRVTVNAGLREEPFIPVHNARGMVHHFEDSWFVEGRKSKVFTNSPAGYIYEGDDGYPGRSNYFGHLLELAPRLGLVIDPRGDGRETIRAAWGVFHETPLLWLMSSFPSDPPWGYAISIPNPLSTENPWVGYPGGNPFPTPNPLPRDLVFPTAGTYSNIPLHVNPMYVQQWNLSFQKQLGANWLASASYIGNKTTHLWLGHDINYATYIPGNCAAGQYGLTAAGACSTTSNTNQRRRLYLLNPDQGKYYAAISQTDDGANANYNGMLLSLQKRFSGKLSWNTNYTWSKCLNDGDPGQNIGSAYPDPTNRRTNRGVCGPDLASIVNSSLLVESPRIGPGLAKSITGGWQVSSIYTFMSGDPVDITSPGDLALNGTSQRAILVGDPHLANPTTNQWFNTAAFAKNTPGVWGNVSRNFVRGPRNWNVDTSLSRRFQVTEGQRLEVRFEAFNVFNRFRPGDPTGAINSGNFGKITSALDPRILQFAAKYTF